jgi:FMN phosphatase YigB (HAD superfamily)
MLSSLFPQVEWERVAAVGFDMDGTLYDEWNFIAQVYRPIAAVLGESCDVQPQALYTSLLERWRALGSSYNRLFEEVALAANPSRGRPGKEVIERCLKVYREFEPILSLSREVASLLDDVRARYPMFLVTDGSAGLQQRKFDALGLRHWFDPEHVVLTARLGEGICKPAPTILPHIKLAATARASGRIVYFGDRDIDEAFARNAGFDFVRVRVMQLADGAAA